MLIKKRKTLYSSNPFYADLTYSRMATSSPDTNSPEMVKPGLAPDQRKPQPEFGNGGDAEPAELESFFVTPVNQAVLVKWETAARQETESFEIERSTDGRVFLALGRITGRGQTDLPQAYSFADQNPTKGLSYYRLRLTDSKGNESLSRVAAITLGKNLAATVEAFPNPFTDKLKLNIVSPAGQELLFKVMDSRGTVLFSEKLNLTEGSNQREYDFLNLPPGPYMLTFTGSDSLVIKRLQKI